MNERVLITGAGGFIGRHVAKRLFELGYRTICVDFERNFKAEDEGIRYGFDISKYSNFDSVAEDVDVIFHIAGQSTGYTSMVEHEKDVDWNAKGTANVCQFARKKDVKKVIYTSSMAVYGNGSFRKETDKLNPLSNYAVSKLAGEFYVKTLAQYGITYAIYRLWNTYGPGQNMENPRNGIVSCYLAQALKGKRIEVTGSYLRFRDLVYIDDTVEALLTGLQPLTENETFNVCNSKETSVREMLDAILIAHDDDIVEFTIENIGSHDGDQSGSSGDNSKLRGAGWTPKVPYEEGIRRFYEYEKKRR